MTDEYATHLGDNYNVILNLMWKYAQDSQNKYHRRGRLKSYSKFWKKKA